MVITQKSKSNVTWKFKFAGLNSIAGLPDILLLAFNDFGAFE